ncbi:MAG: hypothetical protein U1F68_16690 [Gammaproteobacteria bacterium]
MELLDLPSPLFQTLDAVLGLWLPPWAGVVIWAALSASVSMMLYRRLSDQGALDALKPRLRAARQALASYDGPFDGLPARMGEAMRLSVRQVRLTLWPALLSSLPVLLVAVWLGNARGASFPPAGTLVEISAWPVQAAPSIHWTAAQPPVQAVEPGRWRVAWPGSGAILRMVYADGATVLELPLPAPAGLVHKRVWWNALIGNPAGYLPAQGPLERIELNLPEQQLLGFGPGWLRTWPALYFTVLFAVSLGLKWYGRIH